MNIEQVKVRNGESIQTAWDRLVRWVGSLKVQHNDMISVNETPNGTIVKVRREPKTYNHPFKVYGNKEVIKVSAGMVNGTVPFINDIGEKTWRRIDNRDDGGGKYDPQKPTPAMKLDAGEIEGNKTYIGIEVKSSKSGTIENPKEDLRIIQSSKPEGPGGGSQKGYYPIALLYFDEKSGEIDQKFQITHHNIRYIKQAKESENKKIVGNQHLFFPS
jgi:hypothetical protein